MVLCRVPPDCRSREDRRTPAWLKVAGLDRHTTRLELKARDDAGPARSSAGAAWEGPDDLPYTLVVAARRVSFYALARRTRLGVENARTFFGSPSRSLLRVHLGA